MKLLWAYLFGKRYSVAEDGYLFTYIELSDSSVYLHSIKEIK